VQLTDTGLCLELNRAGVRREVNRYRFVFELNRAGVRREVNRYRFVFGTE
jgi:hypothetical protein